MARRIFVNYRRDDVRADARDIAGRLARAFGRRSVFMDVDNLLAGQRFDVELEKALARCDIFLAIIGKHWMELLKQRRTTGERDYVVEEITAALGRGIPVVPVLVDGAPLPRQDDLPEAISELVLYQKHEVTHEHFGRDAGALIAAIKAGRGSGGGARKPWGRFAAGVAIVAGLVALALWRPPFVMQQWDRLAGLVGESQADKDKRAAEARESAAEEKRRQEAAARLAAVEKARREADEERKRAAAEVRQKSEEKRKREARLRAEGRVPVRIGLPGKEEVRWLKPGAGKTERFRDCADCPEMVVVPEGTYMRSSANDDTDEKPVKEVTIANPFAVGKFEVTWAEWETCVKAGGCDGSGPGKSGGDNGWGKGRRPVIEVSWHDAKAYADWLSKRTGRTYRLLSEAEWEYAARGNKGARRYWWGDKIGKGNANCDGCGSKWDNKQTAPVGEFPANPFGLHDMHGNVWEWVADCYVDSYKDAPTDGTAQTTEGCSQRVLRGGSWFNDPRSLRSAYRGRNRPGDRGSDLGFRVSRTLTP